MSLHFRQDLLEQETGVLVGECIVFERTIVGPPENRRQIIADVAGVNEDSHGHRHASGMDEVIEHHRDVK